MRRKKDENKNSNSFTSWTNTRLKVTTWELLVDSMQHPDTHTPAHSWSIAAPSSFSHLCTGDDQSQKVTHTCGGAAAYRWYDCRHSLEAELLLDLGRSAAIIWCLTELQKHWGVALRQQHEAGGAYRSFPYPDQSCRSQASLLVPLSPRSVTADIILRMFIMSHLKMFTDTQPPKNWYTPKTEHHTLRTATWCMRSNAVRNAKTYTLVKPNNHWTNVWPNTEGLTPQARIQLSVHT